MTPLPGLERVEAVGNATLDGDWVGPKWMSDAGELDYAALTEWTRKLPFGRRIMFDIERSGVWNADIRNGTIDGYIERATLMIEAVRAAENGNGVGFYDSFREDFYPLFNNANLAGLRAANDALAPVIERQDFHVCKCYMVPGISAATIPKAVNAYCDEAVRSSRGKPVLMLVSPTAYSPVRQLNDNEIDALTTTLAARNDIAGVIWWCERDAKDSVVKAANAMETKVEMQD